MEGKTMTDESNNPEPNPEPAKTFTQEELDKIVQERLAQLTRKFEREQEDSKRKAKEQADLEKLQGEERIKKQYELDRTKLTEERDGYLRELKLARAESMLASKGLDTKFAPTMIGDSDDSTKANIEALEKLIGDMVTAKTKEALAKGAPPANGGGSSKDDLLAIARKAAGLE